MIGLKLKEKLNQHKKSKLKLVFVSSLLILVSAAVLLTLAAFLLFSLLFYILLIIPLALLLLYFYFLRQKNLYEVAREVEFQDKSWKDSLSTATDIANKNNPREIYSTELQKSFIESIEKELSPKKLSLVKEKHLFRISALLLGITLLIAIILGLVFSQRIKFGAMAVFQPDKVALKLRILNKDTLLIPGERIDISAAVESPVNLNYVYLIIQNGNKLKTQRIKLRNSKAKFNLKVNSETYLRFKRFGVSSKELYLGLLQPFEISKLSLTITPPKYTKLKPHLVSQLSFSAIPGSIISIDGQASASLSYAKILIGDSTVNLKVKSKNFKGTFRILGPQNITLSLKTRAGTELKRKFEILINSDQTPLVEVFLPAEDTKLNRNMTLNIGVHALDDYGLDKIILTASGIKDIKIPLASSRGKLEDTIYYRWDLSELNMLPGDELTYCIMVSDNDMISGPKWGKSKTYKIRFPGIDEIFSKVTEHSQETISELQNLKTRQETAAGELNRIQQKLRAEQNLSYDEKKTLEEIINNEKTLLNNVDSLAQSAKNMLDELRKGSAFDEETAENLTKLSQMLAQLMPPELQQKLEQLSKKLEENPQKLAEMMEQTSQLNNDFQNQLEQALAVLEKFLQEQKLAELAKQAEALAKMEDNLIKEASQLSKNNAAARQKEIEKGLKKMASETSQLAKGLQDEKFGKELSDISQKFSKEDIRLSKKIEQSLRNGKLNKQNAGRLEKNLREAAMRLSQLNMGLHNSRQSQLANQTASLIRELLLLSEELEKTLPAVKNGENLELAAQATEMQAAIENSKENLFQLASQSFDIPRKALHSLSQAGRAQEEFKNLLIKGKKASAMAEGKRAQNFIDQTALSLLESNSKSCNQIGNAANGLEQMMQALSNMSLAQLSINQQMQGMFPLPISANMSAAQKQALSKLLGEQRALRQQLEQLKAQGSQPGLDGMLEGIIEEMLAIEEELAAYTGQRELIDRGEQVFRKLLDARNVVRKQESKQERRRELGNQWQDLASPSLTKDEAEKKLWLKKELMRFLRADYPEEYKRVARTYLKQLLEED